MAYVKQNWENLPSTNTPITAERLNHMEDGIYEASEQGGGTTIEVINSYSESTENPYSANYVNGLTERNAISVGLETGSSSYQTYTNGATLNVSKIQNQVGDKFTTSGNNVVVGAGISKVKVQLNLELRYNATTSKYYRISLTKNGTQISDFNSLFIEIHKQLGEVCAGGSGTKIIDVQEGDTLGLIFNSSSSSTDINWTTGMYIEAVE